MVDEINNDAPILPLTRSELITLSSVMSLTCLRQSDNYTEAKKKKIHPKYLNDERNALLSCALGSYTCAKEKCSEEFDALKDCMTGKNKKKWIKCQDLERSLQACAIKNRCGK
mmetsp:Transcript_3289/g.4215  ORF Transcript_3289/g.4215 Transcript_3289/m.4215 type:complete len:113 (+) Transcript_3289:90-428(+)